jgi:hypothetical protein
MLKVTMLKARDLWRMQIETNGLRIRMTTVSTVFNNVGTL